MADDRNAMSAQGATSDISASSVPRPAKRKPAPQLHVPGAKPFNPHAPHKPAPQLHVSANKKPFNPHAPHKPAPQKN
ncbi:MAG TPA: hypothetical protein VE338_10485 [Ktedonobacterales bacterium]|jgi:hypothetical protein|nr:hypothetical protein [Ktedonobacterales bacterium]